MVYCTSDSATQPHNKYVYTAPTDTKKSGKINSLLPPQKSKNTKITNGPLNVVPTQNTFKQVDKIMY
jgi:hypothetical protein